MKKILLSPRLAILLICQSIMHSSYAQFDSSNNVLPDIREPYSKLDKSRISSGLLYERTLPLSGIENYNGKGNHTAGAEDWSQVYLEMYNASFAKFTFSSAEIKSRCADYYEQGKNPLLIQCYNYNRIKAVAIDSAYLDSSGGYYYDGSNRSTSPYENAIAFSFTPAYRSCADQAITFKLTQDLYFSNQASLPSEIKVDFDDGSGWQLLQFGDEVSINYSGTNPRTLKIQLKYPSGAVFTGTSSVQKMPPLITKLPKKGALEFKELTPYEFTASRKYIENFPRGIATVKFGYNQFQELHECLVKPIIIVEGIDFGYPLKPTGCQFGKCGALGFIDFLTGRINHLINGSTEAFPEIEKAPDFMKQLNELGYDVIYLDFADGATFMEDNAMLLVELIEEINRKKCSDEQLVVIGASMGGQIAKFALSYMESRNLKHCTRLYVSFDSPHQGANVPLGIQHYIKSMESVNDAASDAVYRILCRNASRQLLVNHFEQDQKDGPQTHWARFWWLSNVNNEGNYPKHCRKLAISNGSGIGRSQSFSSSAKLYEWYMGPLNFAEIWASPGRDLGKSYNLLARIKLPAQKEKLIKAHWKQMPAFDNAPGSTRNNTRGLDNVPFGTAVIHWSRQSFISTLSSLDYNSNNLFLDISAAANIKSNIPFDDYYLQANNQPHMQITLNGTPSSPGNGNADWAIQQIMHNDAELPAQLASVYNFGSEHVKQLGSVKILQNGKLQVNANYPTKSGSGPVPIPGSSFNLSTTECDPVISIDAGGILELGDKTTQNKATVYFRKGSTLNILPEGTLIINNNSRLVLEEGASLNFYPGARIQLDGNDAILQISGKLTVKNTAVFSFLHSPGTQSGFIRFIRNENSVIRIYCEGLKSEIELHGDACADKFLEIINCTVEPIHMKLDAANSFNRISLHDGEIGYGRNACFKSGSASSFKNLSLKASGTYISHCGLHTLGQPDLQISSNTFDGLEHGIISEQHVYGNPLLVTDCRFLSCGTAILNNSGSFLVEDSYFGSIRDYGINAFINNSSVVKRCIFSSASRSGIPEGAGISLNCSDNSDLLVSGSSFNSLDKAIHCWGTQSLLTARCVNFNSNTYGIHGESVLGELNLSSNYYIQGENGGSCYFNDNGHAIQFSGRLFLQNGGNNFYSSNSSSPQFIVADIQFNQAQLSGANLSAQGNFFNPSLQNHKAFYDISYLNPFNFHRVLVSLSNAASTMQSNSCQDYNMQLSLCAALGKKSRLSILKGNASEVNDESQVKDGIEFFPNPSKGDFTLRNLPAEQCIIRLFDMNGREVNQLRSQARAAVDIHLPELSDGVYLIQIQTSSDLLNFHLLIRK